MSLKAYLRFSVIALAACSWNQLVAQLTPYYVTTFLCTPNEDANSLCQDEAYTAKGTVAAQGDGYCNAYNNGANPPLNVYALVSANCSEPVDMVADVYPTPQAGDPYHYAVSSGTYTSAGSPDGYGQQACDAQYNYSRNGYSGPC